MKPSRSLGISHERGQLPAVTSGMGIHFTTPTKGRRAPKRKVQKLASSAMDFDAKKRRFDMQLAALMNAAVQPDAISTPSITGSELATDLAGCSPQDTDTACDLDIAADGITPDPSHPPSQPPPNPSIAQLQMKPKRLVPDQAALNLSEKWETLLPPLVPDLLAYYQLSAGKEIRPVGQQLIEACSSQSCTEMKSIKVLALHFGHFRSMDITHCRCRTTAQVLVRAGLFPTAPSQIRMAFSIDFLDFYTKLSERSCDAVNAMAAALDLFYNHRKFYLLNKKVFVRLSPPFLSQIQDLRQDKKFREPFRRGLGYAVQWLDMLHVRLERSVDEALADADATIRRADPSETRSILPDLFQYTQLQLNQELPTEFCFKNLPKAPPGGEVCSRILTQLCPACFGSAKLGRSFEEGGDFHICMDGNLHHRHLASGGQGVPFHFPRHIIPKSFVDEVGEVMDEARKRKPKPRKAKVPDEAIDECQDSYAAADGDKKKSAGARYDAQGWMSLICRHDIPLFFANIDTPGEQQKFGIALLIWFFHHVPANATAEVLYDIGCVLDRSTELYDLLPPTIRQRVQFCTTAMPMGMGLSDGEGVERIWAMIRKLIPLVRTSSAARRLWMTDRQLTFIAEELRDGLGDWIKNRLERGIKAQGNKAQSLLDECGFTVSRLRDQWNLQKEAQMSLRARAPVRIKKEIDTLLSLQTELEDVKKAIQTTQSALSSAPKKTTKILKNLLENQEELIDDLEELYSSLEIQDSFPDLEGVDLEFVRVLLLARDQKIVIRRRAIGSFFEWDRLDQAVGGRNQALGSPLLTTSTTSLKDEEENGRTKSGQGPLLERKDADVDVNMREHASNEDSPTVGNGFSNRKPSDSLPAKRPYREMDSRTQEVANELFPPDGQDDASHVIKRQRQEEKPPAQSPHPTASIAHRTSPNLRTLPPQMPPHPAPPASSIALLPTPVVPNSGHRIVLDPRYPPSAPNAPVPPDGAASDRPQPMDRRVLHPGGDSLHPSAEGRHMQPGGYYPHDNYYLGMRPRYPRGPPAAYHDDHYANGDYYDYEYYGPPAGYQDGNRRPPPPHPRHPGEAWAHQRPPPAHGHRNHQYSYGPPPDEATSSSGASAPARKSPNPSSATD
ncbi:hypothetical protein CVT26_002237 [Gymnopilus dilepis]|uniref:CxC1-like cysteine cluster associated with KDZ transposases domain-containing protein n=1 Tax=Gymnopilus dilepis TaxID=231916 RepID=A0A409YN43_9AGAR|nr:hypothetical protein CVT26_002237 [Gymnopilus dilepis]